MYFSSSDITVPGPRLLWVTVSPIVTSFQDFTAMVSSDAIGVSEVPSADHTAVVSADAGIFEAVGATKIKIQHEHRHDHYSYSASWSMVKDTAKKLIIGLAISTLILTVTLVAVLVHFTNSEMYLGKKYMELYQSDLLTKSEKEKLLKDAYMVSLYPEAYEGYPKAFRERLRKNKSIVDDRELEKIVKGKFSVKEKVGF